MQIEYMGFGAIEKLRDIIKELRPVNIFLVTGKESYDKNMKHIIEPLISSCIIKHFSAFSQNPRFSEVEEGIRQFGQKSYDMILAVGGGSAIDVAKMINIFSAQKCTSIECMQGDVKINKKGKVLVAVPTTAGSGSEATRFAVVYHDNVKYSVDHDFLIPDYAIIDPQLSASLPAKITASSGMDALCQAIESYWCVNSCEESKAFAKEAIILVLKNISKAVNAPTIKSRHEMAKAANLSGKAINITKTTASHAMSYAITTYFGIPHGHAVALTLGKMLVFNSEVNDDDCNDSRGAEYIREAIQDICDIMDAASPISANVKLKLLMREIGLEPELSKILKTKENIALVAKNVDASRLSNNPRKMSEDDIIKILS
ncbi:MAG: phosphonoacetaldehyde reductase [archaeon]